MDGGVEAMDVPEYGYFAEQWPPCP